MKNLLYLLVSCLVVTSCSVDQPETSETNANLAYDASSFDSSSVGNYKGVFTTNNSDYRATVAITIFDNTFQTANSLKVLPTALVTLSNGETFIARADRSVSSGEAISNLEFSGSDMSFKFSVERNGTNPLVTEVTYKTLPGDILVAKNTSLAPVTTFTGTYQCVQCGTSQPRTWNVMIDGDGTDNQSYTTQVTFNGTPYSGSGIQNNCTIDGINTGLTFCDAKGGDAGTDVAFTVGSNEVNWAGQMAYSNGALDCSSLVGTWFFRKGQPEQKSGTFKTDSSPTVANCFSRIAFENFEDANLMYTTSIPEFSNGSEDYFTRTDGSNIAANFNDIIGLNYFAAQDIDALGDAPLQFLSFENLNIAAFSTIYVDAFFAEDDDASSQDWDPNDYVRLEYSFDGTTWTTFGAIEADIETGFNGTPRIDTDLDGIGDGAEITDTFTGYQFGVLNNGTTNPGGSGTVSIRFAIMLDAGDEDIAIDNILIRALE